MSRFYYLQVKSLVSCHVCFRTQVALSNLTFFLRRQNKVTSRRILWPRVVCVTSLVNYKAKKSPMAWYYKHNPHISDQTWCIYVDKHKYTILNYKTCIPRQNKRVSRQDVIFSLVLYMVKTQIGSLGSTLEKDRSTGRLSFKNATFSFSFKTELYYENCMSRRSKVLTSICIGLHDRR